MTECARCMPGDENLGHNVGIFIANAVVVAILGASSRTALFASVRGWAPSQAHLYAVNQTSLERD